MKEEVKADGAVPCSLLQVCWLIRRHATVQGLSIGWGNAASAVTLVFVQSCVWGRRVSSVIFGS